LPLTGWQQEVNQVDLAPYLDISLEQIADNVRQMNPQVTIIPVSAKTGERLDLWFNWVRSRSSPGH